MPLEVFVGRLVDARVERLRALVAVDRVRPGSTAKSS
jgi:hypothetical protein